MCVISVSHSQIVRLFSGMSTVKSQVRPLREIDKISVSQFHVLCNVFVSLEMGKKIKAALVL